MEKAILVMDMPKKCMDCPCEYEGRCEVKFGIYVSLNEKPSWCPLKPMPEKKKIEIVQEDYDGGYSHGFTHGFNACIDAICGKE